MKILMDTTFVYLLRNWKEAYFSVPFSHMIEQGIWKNIVSLRLSIRNKVKERPIIFYLVCMNVNQTGVHKHG